MADDSAYGKHLFWHTLPDSYALKDNGVHVWRISLESDLYDLSVMRDVLSADEIKRADRFLRPEHGEQFTIGRGALRHILSRYVEGSPDALQFCYNEYGKPALVQPEGARSIRFNVSHTGKLAVVGVSQHSALGIDIERYRETLEIEKVARRYFAPVEVEQLRSLPEEQQEKAFYRCWSSKEAFMKVVGQGLSIGLSNFHVEVNPQLPPSIIHTNKPLASIDIWECLELPMDEGMSGVLAVEGVLGEVSFFRFEV